jgi:hypothetical protein
MDATGAAALSTSEFSGLVMALDARGSMLVDGSGKTRRTKKRDEAKRRQARCFGRAANAESDIVGSGGGTCARRRVIGCMACLRSFFVAPRESGSGGAHGCHSGCGRILVPAISNLQYVIDVFR